MFDLFGQKLSAQVFLKDQLCRTCGNELTCVDGLVVVGSKRIGDEDNAFSQDRQLGDGRCPGPADHQVRFSVMLFHMMKEGFCRSGNVVLGVCFFDNIFIRITCLMDEGNPVFGLDVHQCRHDGRVDTVRSLTPTDDEDSEGVFGGHRAF